MSVINVNRSNVYPVLQNITGTGPGTIYFVKDATPRFHGEPGNFVFGLYNVVGTFSSISINLEFTPNLGASAYWETVASWTPLTQPMLVAQCSEAGFYRLNVTAWAGGTQFDVWSTIGNSPAITATGGGSVTQGTSPWVVSGTVTAANASVGALSAATPTSATLIGGTDGTDLQPITIKKASTVATATDTSLVVQVSPNQPTSNMIGTVPGTAPANTTIVGGIYDATSPAPTTGQTLPLQLDNAGNLRVATTAQLNTIDPNNTSSTPLLANATYTGTKTLVANYASLLIALYSDQASSSGGFQVQFSPDGTNWDYIDHLTYAGGGAGTGEYVPLPVKSEYYRIVYTNGSINQTTFRLQVQLIPVSVLLPIEPIEETPGLSDTALFVRAVLCGQNPSGVFNNVGTDANGNLFVTAPNSYNSSVASWTTSTVVNTVASIISAQTTYTSLSLGFSCNSGTFSTGVVAFEGSLDGTDWVAVTGSQPNGTTSSTLILSSATYTLYQFNVAGFSYFRVRLSTAITGTGTLTVQAGLTGNAGAAAVTVSGSVTIGNMPGAGTPGTAVPGSALYAGTRAATALPTAVTNGQLAGAMSDTFGRQVVIPGTIRGLVQPLILSNNSGSTAQNFGAVGGAGIYLDISSFVVTNRSATATVVSLSDGTNTYTYAIAANGGMVYPPPVPIPAATTATQWTVLNSAAVACDYMALAIQNR